LNVLPLHISLPYNTMSFKQCYFYSGKTTPLAYGAFFHSSAKTKINTKKWFGF